MSSRTRTLGQTRRRRLTLRTFRLAGVSGPVEGRSWEVEGDAVTIGSGPENDVVLADDAVSARHCVVHVDADGHLELVDRGSKNGTWVGAVAVREGRITDGASLRVGRCELTVTTAEQAVVVRASADQRLDGLVGASRAMREVFGVLRRVAPTTLTLLLTGETGTGKEVAARAVHALSTRARGPFQVFDCAAVSPQLVEAALFGHERGAYTGADRARPGAFEVADGGTLFLDEVGELPLELQPKLLRVLQDRRVVRVGDTTPRPVDVRIVAATLRDLQREVREGRFRADLFFRLAVVQVELPPLRTRLEDIDLLVPDLLARAREATGAGVRGVDDDVMAVFRAYHWPGNVRELANTLERAVPFTDGPLVGLPALPGGVRAESAARGGTAVPAEVDAPFKVAKERLLEAFERAYFEELYRRHGRNVSKLARAADLDRRSVRRILEKHGIR